MKCDNEGNILHLDLGLTDAKGILSTKIQLLSKLHWLDVSYLNWQQAMIPPLPNSLKALRISRGSGLGLKGQLIDLPQSLTFLSCKILFLKFKNIFIGLFIFLFVSKL